MKLGVIGYGNRADYFIGRFFDADRGVELSAVADVAPEKARERLAANKCLQKHGMDTYAVRFYNDYRVMMEQERLDGVMIATQCHLHSTIAADVMPCGVPIFLEKPVSVTFEQLRTLSDAYRAHRVPAVVSFPLRFAPICRHVKTLVDSGLIGKVQQVQAINNVPYGPSYYKGFDKGYALNGGLWPQKATHDLDYVNYLVGEEPVELCAMESKTVYVGGHSPELKCPDCSENKACPESPHMLRQSWEEEPDEESFCSFSTNRDSHDSASALVRYESGIHAVYTQNFFSRKNARKRGAILIGYRGTIQFDFYTSKVRVFMHDGSPDAEYTFQVEGKPHFGGDLDMARNFIGVMEGGPSLAPMETGIVSALMCISAMVSCKEKRFMPLHTAEWVENSPVR